MSDEHERRIQQLEERDQAIQENMNQLVTNTAVMNETLKHMSEKVIPKVEQLEIKLANAMLVISAIKWLSTTVGAGAILMVLAYLFGNGG